MAPKVSRAALVAELAELPADERADVVDAARALSAPRAMRSAAEIHADMAARAARVHAGEVELLSGDDVLRELREELDL